MEVLVLGMSHKSAPLEVREKVTLASNQLAEALRALLDYVEQGVILSTCNRMEVYSVADRPNVLPHRLERFLEDYFHLPVEVFSPHVYRHYRGEAVRHLYKVASGADSMILGEFEILGQVREALEAAEKVCAAQAPLLNLFRQALRVGRLVREETSISRSAASVSSAGVELARRFFGDTKHCKVLVISAGEAAELTAMALVKMGITEMYITNRTFERAVDLATRLGGKAIPFHHIQETLAASDIVISCSGSPHFILEPPVVEEAMRLRPRRPLFLIDIAVPRDVDPAVKGIDNVFLCDIDDLRLVSEANMRERGKEVEKVLALVDDEVARFVEWWDSLQVVPTITTLTEKYEALRQRELVKALGKLSSLSEEDRARIEAVTRSIVNKMLHAPIVYLKKHSGDLECSQTVRELFQLDEDS